MGRFTLAKEFSLAGMIRTSSDRGVITPSAFQAIPLKLPAPHQADTDGRAKQVVEAAQLTNYRDRNYEKCAAAAPNNRGPNR
jgi:hypothetical protein